MENRAIIDVEDDIKVAVEKKIKNAKKCARCEKTSTLPFWDFFQTDEGYMCEDCEPLWAKDFLARCSQSD